MDVRECKVLAVPAAAQGYVSDSRTHVCMLTHTHKTE